MAYTACNAHGDADSVAMITDKFTVIMICGECFRETLQDKGLKLVADRWQK